MGTVEDKIVSINTLYCCKTVIYIKTPFSGVDKDPISTLRLILIMHVYISNRSLIKLRVLQLLYKMQMAHSSIVI